MKYSTSQTSEIRRRTEIIVFGVSLKIHLAEQLRAFLLFTASLTPTTYRWEKQLHITKLNTYFDKRDRARALQQTDANLIGFLLWTNNSIHIYIYRIIDIIWRYSYRILSLKSILRNKREIKNLSIYIYISKTKWVQITITTRKPSVNVCSAMHHRRISMDRSSRYVENSSKNTFFHSHALAHQLTANTPTPAHN